MKREVMLVLLALLLIPGVQSQRTVESMQLAGVEVRLDSVEPEPVEPGERLSVRVRAINTRGVPQKATIDLQADWPFQLVYVSQQVEDIEICPGCSQHATFHFIVDPAAPSGEYPINLVATMGAAEYKEVVDIRVLGTPQLIFQSSQHDDLVPNSKFRLHLAMKNMGTGRAHTIQAKATTSDYFAVSGSSAKEIKNLKPEEETETYFDFLVDENTPSGVYVIPIEIHYRDEEGTEHIRTLDVGVRVIDKAEINLQSIKFVGKDGELVRKGQPFSLIVRVENVGYGDADFTQLKLECPLQGSLTAFVGNLEADEDAPASFEVRAEKAGHYKCPIVIRYQDDLGWQQYSQPIEIQVYNHTLRTFLIWLAIIAGAAAGGYYYYKKRHG